MILAIPTFGQMPWKGKMLAHFWRMLSLRELSRDSHGDCEFYQLVWEVLLGNQWTMREMIVTEPFQQTSLIFSQAHTLIEMPGFGWILCHPCGHTNEKNLTQGDKWGPQWEWERISLIHSHPRWKKMWRWPFLRKQETESLIRLARAPTRAEGDHTDIILHTHPVHHALSRSIYMDSWKHS